MTDAEKKEISKKGNKKAKRKAISSSSRFIFLILIISTALTVGLYLLWENQQQVTIKQQLTIQRIDGQLAAIKQQQIDAATQNENQITKIQSFQENLRHNLTNLIRNNQHLRNDWLMAEAEYLIKLANHRILLEKDVATAIVALMAADARLAEVADPALLHIRKVLNSDLQALKNVSTIDLAGLSVTISSLSSNIPNLPLRTPDPKTHKITQEEKVSASSEVKGIKDLPAAIWKDIRSLIIIRNHDKPLEPLLAPNQHFFLVQNLALLLEQSRLALLNGNNAIYQERLGITLKWIEQYFDSEHNVTRNMIANINELLEFNIDPALPNISSTFSAIKEYRTKGLSPNNVKENVMANDK